MTAWPSRFWCLCASACEVGEGLRHACEARPRSPTPRVLAACAPCALSLHARVRARLVLIRCRRRGGRPSGDHADPSLVRVVLPSGLASLCAQGHVPYAIFYRHRFNNNGFAQSTFGHPKQAKPARGLMTNLLSLTAMHGAQALSIRLVDGPIVLIDGDQARPH